MALYYFLAIFAGMCISTQAGVNSQLRQTMGNPFAASLISFIIGAIGLFIYSSVSGNLLLSELATLKNISLWKLSGGLLGGIYVTAVIISAPKIGAANLIGLVIAGQISLAVILDHFGLLGFAVHPITLMRIMGTILLISGVYIIQRT